MAIKQPPILRARPERQLELSLSHEEAHPFTSPVVTLAIESALALEKWCALLIEVASELADQHGWGLGLVPPWTLLLLVGLTLSVGLLFAITLFLKTQVRRKTADLCESEQSLATTLYSISEGVIATDAAGLITRMNAAAERLTGWKFADAAGRPLPEVFHVVDSETGAVLTNPVPRVMAGGASTARPKRTTLLAQDGREYQIADSAAPIRNRDGTMVGVVLIFSDVTDDERARQELATMSDLLERTGEMARVGGWEFDLRNRQFLWSREVCRIHDLDTTPTLEYGLSLFTPTSRPIIDAAFQAAVDFGTPYDLELQKVTAKGRAIWVRVQGSAMRADGQTYLLRGVIHDITERKSMQDQVHQMAFHDPLTQLPNRHLLSDRLNQAMAANERRGCHAAVMMLDLDNFKTLNDTHGHLAGDSLLVEAANRLKDSIREMDTVARFGGDEFVVLLSTLNVDREESTVQASLIAEKIRVRLSESYWLTVSHPGEADLRVEHRCSASIGVVVFESREASPLDIFKWADSAMYLAKAAGRNSVRMCTREWFRSAEIPQSTDIARRCRS